MYNTFNNKKFNTSRILNNKEAIMNKAIAISTAHFLDGLFSEYKEKAARYKNDDKFLHDLTKAFQLLKKYLKQETIEKAIKNAANLLKMQDSLLDISVDGKDYPARKIFKFVFIAIFDNQIYQHPNNTEKAKINRLLTLCKTLLVLEEEKKCPRRWGIELAAVLIGVYPGCSIIQDVKGTIWQVADSFFTDVLKTTKIEKHFKIIEQWFNLLNSNELKPKSVLDNFFKEIIPNLVQHLNQFFSKHNLDPKEERNQGIAREIKKYIQYPILPNEYQRKYTLLMLQNIYKRNGVPNYNGLINFEARNLIMMNIMRIDFTSANSYENAIMHFPLTMKRISIFNRLEEILEKYLINYNRFTTNSLHHDVIQCFKNLYGMLIDPNKFISDNNISILIDFCEKSINAQEKEFNDFVINFFTKWNLRRADHATIQLWKLCDPITNQCDKIIVNSEQLNRIFPQNQSEIWISPLEINMIFLTALLASPTNTKIWTDTFVEYLERVIKFVEHKLSSPLNTIALALKKHSYTEFIMMRLKFLISLYKEKITCPFEYKDMLSPLLRALPDRAELLIKCYNSLNIAGLLNQKNFNLLCRSSTKKLKVIKAIYFLDLLTKKNFAFICNKDIPLSLLTNIEMLGAFRLMNQKNFEFLYEYFDYGIFVMNVILELIKANVPNDDFEMLYPYNLSYEALLPKHLLHQHNLDAIFQCIKDSGTHDDRGLINDFGFIPAIRKLVAKNLLNQPNLNMLCKNPENSEKIANDIVERNTHSNNNHESNFFNHNNQNTEENSKKLEKRTKNTKCMIC